MVECTRSPLTFFGRKVEQIKTGFLLTQLRAKVPGILQQAIKEKENYFVQVHSGLYELKYTGRRFLVRETIYLLWVWGMDVLCTIRIDKIYFLFYSIIVRFYMIYFTFYHTRSFRQGFILKYSEIFEP